ncbi:oxidative stress survival, Svf1-like protein [Meredithblackwellia eburnea MCA 4105]
MSWFSSSSSADSASKIHPVQLSFDQEALYGPLSDEDTAWVATSSGFITETQVFYATTPTGGIVMCQVIHSSVGLWYPSIQFTFRYIDQSTNTHVWKSVAVTNFVVGPPASGGKTLDRRSLKSDQFTITVDPASPGKYVIEGKYDDDVQISLVYERLTEGWKVGAGPRGGFTYFGNLKPAVAGASPTTPDINGGGDGYAVHRFWPRCAVSGIVRVGSSVVDLANSRGVFIHAIQGLRPNVLAARWNFANFQSKAEDGVSLIMMEFTSTPAYGSKKVNIGSVVVGDKLVAVTAGGDGVEGTSVAEHQNATKDVETDYEAPGAIKYVWSAPTLDASLKATKELTKASLELELLTSKPGEAYATRGLVEKVDVLGQVPYLVKKFVNYAAGTKPYIYTWLNPAKASIATAGGAPIEVDGYIFNEATFIS